MTAVPFSHPGPRGRSRRHYYVAQPPASTTLIAAGTGTEVKFAKPREFIVPDLAKLPTRLPGNGPRFQEAPFVDLDPASCTVIAHRVT